ncbi:MAG: DUF447 domain-containing protein [Methanosarcinaceae archaeon]
MTESPPLNLDEYGIYDGISETIVTTIQGWFPNAAPIGIIRKDDRIYVRLFKGSTTYFNVHLEGVLVANVVNDPVIFVRSTFSNLKESDFNYVSVAGHKFPVLKDALSWVFFECNNMKITNGALFSELNPLHGNGNGNVNVNVNRNLLHAPNRGFNAVLEAAVHATRYKLTNDDKYLKLIHACSVIVAKCGGKREKIAIDMLNDHLDE